MWFCTAASILNLFERAPMCLFFLGIALLSKVRALFTQECELTKYLVQTILLVFWRSLSEYIQRNAKRHHCACMNQFDSVSLSPFDKRQTSLDERKSRKKLPITPIILFHCALWWLMQTKREIQRVIRKTLHRNLSVGEYRQLLVQRGFSYHFDRSSASLTFILNRSPASWYKYWYTHNKQLSVTHVNTSRLLQTNVSFMLHSDHPRRHSPWSNTMRGSIGSIPEQWQHLEWLRSGR